MPRCDFDVIDFLKSNAHTSRTRCQHLQFDHSTPSPHLLLGNNVSRRRHQQQQQQRRHEATIAAVIRDRMSQQNAAHCVLGVRFECVVLPGIGCLFGCLSISLHCCSVGRTARKSGALHALYGRHQPRKDTMRAHR